MRIFDQTKTREIPENEIDIEKGYLEKDKLFIAHHNAVEAQEAVYSDREVIEESGGISVYKDLVTPAIEAREAYDEYEDIKVFVPYSAEEFEKIRLNKLRAKRQPLLEAFDKWEKAVLRGREEDDKSVMDWYYDLLDLTADAFESVPERVEYYL